MEHIYTASKLFAEELSLNVPSPVAASQRNVNELAQQKELFLAGKIDRINVPNLQLEVSADLERRIAKAEKYLASSISFLHTVDETHGSGIAFMTAVDLEIARRQKRLQSIALVKAIYNINNSIDASASIQAFCQANSALYGSTYRNGHDANRHLLNKTVSNLRYVLDWRLLGIVNEIGADDGTPLSPSSIKAILDACLNRIGSAFKVQMSDTYFSPSIDHAQKIIYVPNRPCSRHRIKRLIANKLLVHATRSQNSEVFEEYRVLTDGTSSYESAEEGLGILFESIAEGGVGEGHKKALLRYQLCHTIATSGQTTFRELFDNLATQWPDDRELILDELDRAFRFSGLLDADGRMIAPECFFKMGQMYYAGLVKVVNYFDHLSSQGQVPDFLFIMSGRFDFTNRHEVRQVRVLQMQETHK